MSVRVASSPEIAGARSRDHARPMRRWIVAPILVAALSGCGDMTQADLTVAPTAPAPLSRPPVVPPAQPPVVPPAQPPVPTTLGPDFPPVSEGAVAFDQADEDLYRPYFHIHEGRLRSRFELREDGTFVLRYSSPCFGLFSYEGRRVPAATGIGLAFVADGRWFAEATVDGDELHVRFNVVMSHSDFMDGTYVRVRASP